MMNNIENEFIIVSCRKRTQDGKPVPLDCLDWKFDYKNCTLYYIQYKDFISCYKFKVDWITFIKYQDRLRINNES